MCGIYGYIKTKGEKKPLEECLKGLAKLQYRGYDSAGVASIHDGNVLSFKTVGKVELLDRDVKANTLELSSAIAHTRWATHGGLSTENTHPHIDYKNSLALVHNGIVENYLELKASLKSKGVPFVSETDTEVLTNLISYTYKGSVKDAIAETLQKITGSFAIVLMHKDFPDTIFAAARNCPLAIGLSENGSDIYVSSDPSSFHDGVYSTLFLADDEIAAITNSQTTVYDSSGALKAKKNSRLVIEKSATEKNGHEHYMHKEMHEQSLLCRDILKRRKQSDTFYLAELANDESLLKQTKHIEIIACGSSYNAGLITKEYLEMLTGIPVSVHLASEYRYRFHLPKKDTVAVVISQSGETADTLAALRLKKPEFLLTIALCNVENSTLTRECDRFIPLYVGKEISVCSTKAFTGQLLNLYILGIHLSNLLEKDNTSFATDLQNIPFAVDDILNREASIKELAIKYSSYSHFFLTGRGVMYPVSKEAALKLKEISYLPAENLPAGEMKHGPIALIDSMMPTIAFLNDDEPSSKTLSNLSEIKARKGPLLIFSTNTHYDLAEDTIQIPKTGGSAFSSIPFSLAGQLFAYHLAKELGREIDLPRNLAKSVTVE